MSDPVLERDSEIVLPQVMVLRASAGSGKTHALTKRFAQFLLSESIPRNGLRNILAITFSNNAAKEMKERVLGWLKGVCLGDAEAMRELAEVLFMDTDRLRQRAALVLDEIITNYGDFQVKTIDSFMTTIFKASAIDFGYSPDFEILMTFDRVMEYAFGLFLRDVREGSEESRFLGDIVRIIEENRAADATFLWDPTGEILKEIVDIYRKLSQTGKAVRMADNTAEMARVRARIRAVVEGIERTIAASGFERSKSSTYATIREAAEAGRFTDLIGRGTKLAPVRRPKVGAENGYLYDEIMEQWNVLGSLVKEYSGLYAVSYYLPYLRACEAVRDGVERVKRNEGKVFIEDINRRLAEYLNEEVVPDIFFRIGEVIYHYLIDEFQDTSPIQWQNLVPLLDNALAQGGSLFVVGDTKQAIYGFRDADYEIMKKLETENPFPSAHHLVRDLDVNYRSLEQILAFNERVFRQALSASDKYRETARKSGLTEYVQRAREADREGYVECRLYERNDESPPEKEKLCELMEDLKGRGYSFGDITILTPRNDDVVMVTAWLSQWDVPFVAYSSLDVRRRRVTGEIVALLSFLDAPMDELSFATFILGEVFERARCRRCMEIDRQQLRELLLQNRGNQGRPLYKAFQESFPDLWAVFFDDLFRLAGYLPLYDLASAAYRIFDVFATCREKDEGVLTKILEVIKDFEGKDGSTLRDFLRFASGEEGEGDPDWNVSVPHGLDAVKVMTIHKAKGLGFPVVIVLLYGERNRGFKYVVQDAGSEVCLLRLNRGLAATDPDFEALYRREEVRRDVSRLNTLYVGFTRATSELYVLGVKREREAYPFDVLPEDGFGASGVASDLPPRPAAEASCMVCYYHEETPRVPEAVEGSLNFEEKRRGDYIHRVLSLIDYVGGGFDETLERLVARVEGELGYSYPSASVRDAILRFVTLPTVEDFYAKKPDRELFLEQEFVDADGRLFRMDRVVADPDRVTVLDFKTGGEGQGVEKYRAQMRAYLAILRSVYPDRNVEGILAYVDEAKVEVLR